MIPTLVNMQYTTHLIQFYWLQVVVLYGLSNVNER
jgi:hypothetical protein